MAEVWFHVSCGHLSERRLEVLALSSLLLSAYPQARRVRAAMGDLADLLARLDLNKYAEIFEDEVSAARFTHQRGGGRRRFSRRASPSARA